MQRFSKGDRVRVDIPDETDPDHQEYHGKHGEVVAVLSDDADSLTAEERDAQLYRVAFDSGEAADFR
jgi:ribosomal protein L21E